MLPLPLCEDIDSMPVEPTKQFEKATTARNQPQQENRTTCEYRTKNAKRFHTSRTDHRFSFHAIPTE